MTFVCQKTKCYYKLKVCVKLAALSAERPDPQGNLRTWVNSYIVTTSVRMSENLAILKFILVQKVQLKF